METESKRLFFYYSGKLHNAYRHMVANPPEGFVITASEGMAYNIGGTTASGPRSPFAETLKSLQPYFSQAYNRTLIAINKPKVRRFDATGYDVVHSGQSILETNAPYVMDLEHAAVLCGYNQYALEKKAYVKQLRRVLLDKSLKRITPWSNASRESLLNFVKMPGETGWDKELEAKTETVYPVITPPGELHRAKHEGVNFLFVGNVFYEKGAYDALLAFEKIMNKYDAHLTIVSNIPEEIRARFGSSPKISLLPLQPYEKVKELYGQSDVFVFPTHYDTFGFVIPEALSFGLPIISVDSFSTPELVEHERTGLTVKSFYTCYRQDRAYRGRTADEVSRERMEMCRKPTPEYVGEMAKAMERLIEDGSLRNKLAHNARKETIEGKFSPKAWKQKMGRIYREAME